MSTVTLLISARNRPGDLCYTLRKTREQTRVPDEVIVIDDCSDAPLAPHVLAEWPTARVIRNETNMGLVASRSAGMRLASGTYILTLDDDSNLTHPDDLKVAVERLEREPELGIISFKVYTGPELSQQGNHERERYVASFCGCANMMRASMVRSIGTFFDPLFYYYEETEYSLRALAGGWRILRFPDVVVLHRMAMAGRQSDRIFGFSMRNALWTVVLHYPFPRILMELAWKSGVFTLETLRGRRFAAAWWGLRSLVGGLPTVLRARRPMSRLALRRLDALRVRTIASAAEFDDPPRTQLRDRVRWLRHVWWATFDSRVWDTERVVKPRDA